MEGGGHGALDGGHTVCENYCIETCWVVVLGGSSNRTQQSLVMCVMTRTAAAGLVLEFVAVCFVLCSGWLQSATKKYIERQQWRGKNIGGGQFQFQILFFYIRHDEGGCI